MYLFLLQNLLDMDIQKNEEEVLIDITSKLNDWKRLANILQGLTILFGFISISSSLFITACAGALGKNDTNIIRLVAAVSAVSLALIGAFNLQGKTSNARNAWRHLNSALYRYKSNSIQIDQLINAYEEGERILGSVEFSSEKTRLLD